MKLLSSTASMVVIFVLGSTFLSQAQLSPQQAKVQVHASATILPGDALQLTSGVTGTSNGVVIWKVNGITGGNSSVGTISTSGLFVAPKTIPLKATVRVTATSEADPTKTATTQVTILSCAPVPFGIVSWWTGEKNGLDLTGANPGTLEGSLSFVPGEVSLGFALDGSTAFLNIPDSASLDSITTAVSLEMWVNSNPLPANSVAYLYARRDPLLMENFSVYLLSDGTLGLLVKTGSSPTTTGSKFESVPGTITFGAMQHIAVTANSNTGIAQAFVSGIAVPLTAVYGPSSFSGTFAVVHNLYLGRRQDASIEGTNGAGYFPGILDEITLYSAELTQNQIQSIVAAGIAGKCR